MRVRFNLGKGQNYMKWQVRDGNQVKHYNPDQVTLIMKGCKLCNNASTAKKIFNGARKSVCAWIDCQSVEIIEPNDRTPEETIQFNPRISPHWRSSSNENIDGSFFDVILSNGKKLYVCQDFQSFTQSVV